MKRVILLALALAVTCTSCAGPGIQAQNISGLVDALTRRHDTYVIDDGSLSDAKKMQYLRSSDILIDNVNAALPEGETHLEKTERPENLVEQPVAPAGDD